MNLNVSGKPSAGEHLSATLQSLRGGLKEAADNIGVSYSSLRQFLARNRFYEEDLVALFRLCGVNTDLGKLQEEYEFDLLENRRGIRRARAVNEETGEANRSLPIVLEEVRRRTDLAIRDLRLASDFVVRLYESMDSSDLQILFNVGDMFPVEWEGGKGELAARAMGSALARGATVCYAFASTRIIDELSGKNGLILQPMPQKSIERSFESFRASLISWASPKDKQAIQSNLGLLFMDTLALWVPYFKFALLIHRGSIQPESYATVNLPVRHSSATGTPGSQLILELNEQFVQVLNIYLHNATKDLKKTALTSDETLNRIREKLEGRNLSH